MGTGLLLRRLDGIKRVLLIGAHPDDEDTALLTALARGMGVETAYLSLSRGEGGQNLIGPELDEGLGLVRTGELLAARSLDGGRQYFTRAFDFGFSKTAEETFRYWPREEILRDVTWIVRTFRPQVIVSVFSGTPRDGHGQHQAAGIMAREVFDAAGDPARFPDQIAAGAPAWTPVKLYRLTRRDPEEGTTGIDTGAFDPLLGRSYFQIAMESRSQHRSQDMGAAQPMGPQRSMLLLVESRMEGEGPDELFTGVDTSLVMLAERLPEVMRDGVLTPLEVYRDAITEAKMKLGVANPYGSAPALAKALSALRVALKPLMGGAGGEFGTDQAPELVRSLQERIPLVQEALLRAAGVVVDARLDDDLLVPGEVVGGVLELWNGGPYSLHEASGTLLGPKGWVAEGELGQTRDVAPGSLAEWRFQLRVPEDAEVSGVYYLREPRAGEMYRWPVDPDLWGAPGDPDLLRGAIHLDVGGLVTVETEKVARFRGVDKATGQILKRLQVVPALAVSLDPPMMAWPAGLETPREFTATVVSRARREMSGNISLQVPEGWAAEPPSQAFLVSETGSEASFSFRVIRPEGVADGKYLVSARVRTQDGAEYEEGVSLVDYPHIRRAALLPPAQSRVSVFPVSLPSGLRVGYVMGSGDDGPDALRQIGAQVDVLGSETLKVGDLQAFDAIVLGIRAYETRPDLAAMNDRVLDYVRSGGTLIVQYNQYEYPLGGYAPYRVNMSRPHDRVSEENAAVRILDPEHPLFRFPNSISAGDFEGWAQERGLYFLDTWGPEFTPLLEMADPGEDPKRGGLLIARLGEGVYVYTGVAFFRQFPEGVPGAHRLFANLVSLKGGGLN